MTSFPINHSAPGRPGSVLSVAMVAVLSLSAVRAEVDFAHDVLPILTKHCTECHTGNKKKGGLAMNTRAELLAGSEFSL